MYCNEDLTLTPFTVVCYELRTEKSDLNRVYYRITRRDSGKKYYVECKYLPISAELVKTTKVQYRIVGRSHWDAQSGLGDIHSHRRYSQARSECEFHDVQAVLAAVSSFIRTKQLDYRGGPLNLPLSIPISISHN
jgi:hypothetical protein